MINEVNAGSDGLSFPITALAYHQNYVTDEDTFNAQVKLLKGAKKYHTDVVVMSTAIPFQDREGHPDSTTIW